MSYTFNYKSGGSNRDTFSFYYYLENKGPSRKNIIIFAKGDLGELGELGLLTPRDYWGINLIPVHKP